MSTLNVANIQSLTTSTFPLVKNSAGTEIGRYCRAFCRFNGTGSGSMTSEFNLSGITDNGVGDYTFSFTNPLPDANYAFTIGHSAPVNSGHCIAGVFTAVPTTLAIRVDVFNSSNSTVRADDPRICVAIF